MELAGLEIFAQRMLDAASKAGAEAADVIALQSKASSVDVRKGSIENTERSESTAVGLRVFVGQRQAIVSGSDPSSEALNIMAERGVAMAKLAPIDPHIGLARENEDNGAAAQIDLELCDPADPPTETTLLERALACEAAACTVAGVHEVQSAGASYSEGAVWVKNTNGFDAGYARTGTAHSCVALARNGAGMERDYSGDSRCHAADLRSPEEIGVEAGERTAARLGAKTPPTGQFPVLFDERVASSLIGHLLGAVNGSAIARGASWLRDSLGAAVLPADMSLIEDPHRVRLGSSRLFDAEGLATRKRDIVAQGTLTGWTTDLATARKLGCPPTANAARGVSSGPSPTHWNVSLQAPFKARDDLIAQMGTGLLVTSLIGSTINPNTGDYSRGASGMWIENGVPAYPVNQCTIAGSLPKMMMSLIAADDARPEKSWVVPSILIPEMMIAGS